MLSTLAASGPDRPERHRTMRAAISWGHDLLEPEERRLFAVLSVFRGGFSLDQAARLMNALSKLTLATTLDGVSALVDYVERHPADRAVVITTPHAVADTFHTDWANRAQDKLGIPVLHLYSGSGYIGDS